MSITESTYDVVPQIQEPDGLDVLREHENPATPGLRITEPNSMRVGGVTGNSRVLTGGHPRFGGIGFTGAYPPDPDVAVGPNNVVAMVNSTIAVYSRTGTLLFEQGLGGSSGFFGSTGASDFVSDVKVAYDPIAHRWYALTLDPPGAIGGTGSFVLFAVSATESPLGAWHKYRLNVGLTIGSDKFWLDYPGFGYNKDAIVLTGNMFPESTGGYAGSQLIVVKKSDLLAGSAPLMTVFRDPNVGTVQVCRTADANLDKVYGVTLFSNTQLRVYALTNLGGSNPAMVSREIAVPTFTQPTENAQSTVGRLDVLGDRLFTATWRGGRFVTGHSVRTAGDSTNRCRWYEILTNNWPSTGAPNLQMSGEVPGGSSQHTFVPALNINRNGSVGMLYSRSSSSIVADVMTTGRLVTDPAGTMGTPVRVATSSGSYGGGGNNRWGDYFGVAVDPNDDLTFWGVGMVGSGGGRWTTFISSWNIDNGGSNGTAIAPISVTALEGTTVAGGLAEVLTSDNRYFDVRSAILTRVGQVATTESTFQLTGSTDFASFGMTAELHAVSGTTANIYLFNWSTNAYELIRSQAVGGVDLTTSLNITNYRRFISGSNSVKAAVRTVIPVHTGRGGRAVYPQPFLFRTDLMKLNVVPNTGG